MQINSDRDVLFENFDNLEELIITGQTPELLDEQRYEVQASLDMSVVMLRRLANNPECGTDLRQHVKVITDALRPDWFRQATMNDMVQAKFEIQNLAEWKILTKMLPDQDIVVGK